MKSSSNIQAKIYDYVIVGGGIAGLSAGYHLAKDGYSVAVLDRENNKNNASFNSTAIMSHDPDADWEAIIGRFGIEGARDIWKLSEFSMKTLTEYADAASPSFISKRMPSHIFSYTKEQDEELAEEYELYKKLGARATFTKDGSSIFKNFRACMTVEEEGQTNNQAILKTLVRMVKKHGGKILNFHVATAVNVVGHGVDVVCENGAIISGKEAIVATGEASLVPEVMGKTEKKRTFVLAYEKHQIPKPFRGSVMWDIGEPYHYMRSFHGRIVWIGGEDVYEKDYDPKKNYIAPLEKFAHEFLEFDSSYKRAFDWTGTFYPPEMGLPFISRVKDTPVWVSLGFGGTGILMSFISGYLIASWKAGKEAKYKEYFALSR